jgi:hypothetical protein
MRYDVDHYNAFGLKTIRATTKRVWAEWHKLRMCPSPRDWMKDAHVFKVVEYSPESKNGKMKRLEATDAEV